MKSQITLLLFLLFGIQYCSAQEPHTMTSAEIYQRIEKLNFLGSVLYVAAHPDDENTDLISYLSNEIHAQTAYLSLTRGDGGQNLIGPEIRELLGVIRTEELLAARKIDGGKQFFSRANDFGYSKNPKETFQIWNKEQVLSDVVWIFRQFRPDVIINRFDANSAGETHGHHTASAILSTAAFDMANDPSQFPEQLKYVQTWQPKRMYFNTSWWFYGSEEKFEKAIQKKDFVTLNTGVYFPLKGLSNTEISAQSRSMHKSQGFGTPERRGKEMEYLVPLKGEFPTTKNNIFEGINTSWSRLKNGEAIGNILYEVQRNFDFTNPSANVPQLLKAYRLIQQLENSYWRTRKIKTITEIILACTGIYTETTSSQALAVPGEQLDLHTEIITRSEIPVVLEQISLPSLKKEFTSEEKLVPNVAFLKDMHVKLPENANYTTPYWLNDKATTGMYHVANQHLVGLPRTPNKQQVVYHFKIKNTKLSITKPIVYKKTSPVEGEIYAPFHLVPEVTISFKNPVVIFKDQEPRTLAVKLTAYTNNVEGTLQLLAPANWKIHPQKITLSLPKKGQSKTVEIQVTPSSTQSEIYIQPTFISNGKKYTKKLSFIDYPHLPKQTILLPAKAKLVRLNIKKKGDKIAYIEGAGDVIAENLVQIGYTVKTLSPAEISLEKLQLFDAVVVGIRAYNIDAILGEKQPILLDYVKKGGTLVVQYNKNHDLTTKKLAPYPLELSRDRVTDEQAKVKFLAKNHPVLHTPNEITHADFEGWVQERGLYFADKWGKAFTPIIGMKDQGESMKKGSLLVAKYGKGYYVYTGLSFFREFPAGVPGAFRLFANIVSLGQNEK